MSFWSTYSTASIRGFQSTAGNAGPVVNATVIDAPANNQVYSFGYSVDIDSVGNFIITGGNHGPSTDRNSNVYIYTNNSGTWALQQSFIGNNTANIDGFGTSVAMNGAGNIVAVSAPDKNTNRGEVYIFTRTGNTWTQRANIVGTQAGGRFGDAIDINDAGDILLISQPYSNANGTCYLYASYGNANSWTQISNVSSPNSMPGRFGSHVSISKNANANVGNSLIYSVTNSTVIGGLTPTYGGGYVFANTTLLYANLPNSDINAYYSTSINGNGTIVTFAKPQYPTYTQRFGAIDVFVSNGSNYNYTQTLMAAGKTIDATYFGEFYGGIAIAKNNDEIFGTGRGNVTAGLPTFATNFNETSPNVWTQEIYFNQSETYISYFSTIRVSNSGNTIVVGSPLSIKPGPYPKGRGAITIFEIT